MFLVEVLGDGGQGGLCDGAGGDGNGQVRNLPFVFHVGLGDYFVAGVVEAFQAELAAAFLPHSLDQPGKGWQVYFLEGLEVGLHEVVFHIGYQQTEAAEDAGKGGNDDAGYVEHFGQASGMDGAAPTEAD